jgi:hypothetical protein
MDKHKKYANGMWMLDTWHYLWVSYMEYEQRELNGNIETLSSLSSWKLHEWVRSTWLEHGELMLVKLLAIDFLKGLRNYIELESVTRIQA